MAKEHGGTTCSSSGCGAASNTRRYICGPTKASAKRGTRSAVTSTSIIAAVHIRALTATHRIKPTSTRRQSAWRLNLGRCSTYRRGDSVQTAGTSSDHYEEALTELINAKRQGKTVGPRPRPSGGNVVDLMDALKQSLESEAATTKRKQPRKATAG